MSHKKANDEEPNAMSREEFIAIFSSETKGSRINDVITEDIFVSAMVDAVLLPLKSKNSKDNYLPPYNNFKEADYMDELCKGLNYSDVEILKGRIPNKRKKSEVYGFMADNYSYAALENLAMSFSDQDPNYSYNISSLNLNQGYSFATLVSDDEKIQSNIQKLDVLTDFVLTKGSQNLPNTILTAALMYKTVSTILPLMANMHAASTFRDKEEEAIKKESVADEEWLKRSLIVAIKRKLKKRASDKKTLYSMLKFAKNEKEKKQKNNL